MAGGLCEEVDEVDAGVGGRPGSGRVLAPHRVGHAVHAVHAIHAIHANGTGSARAWLDHGHRGQGDQREGPVGAPEGHEITTGPGQGPPVHPPTNRMDGHRGGLVGCPRRARHGLGQLGEEPVQAGRFLGLRAQPAPAGSRVGGVPGPGVGCPALDVVREGPAIHRGQATVETMTDCLFCRIIAGDVPSDQVLATGGTVAFRDISPAAPVHVLVVPREHVESAAAVDASHGELLAEMVTTAQAVARAEGVAGTGYRLVLNVGDDAQNSVPHLHMHVIGGRPMGWPPG